MANSTGRGHGGAGSKTGYPRDPGATGNGTTEYKEVSWINDQFLKASSSLKDVSDYSAQNVNQNLGNIVANTNKVSKSSELTFSHHKNAFNGKAAGTEVWYYLGDSKGKALAEKLSAAIAKELGIQNRGAKATTDLYVVRNTYATCLLFEWCFVDNANDMKQFNKNKVAAVNAVLEILGYKKIGGTPVTKPKAKSTYYDSGSYFEALQDLKTYLNPQFSKVDNTVFIKKGSKFPVRNIEITSTGTTHAKFAGLNGTYVTLAKSHVKKL